jgi:hypothetical protein
VTKPGQSRNDSNVSAAIPGFVTDRLREWFKPAPEDILSRPAAIWGGKSALQAVRDSDRTWDEVLATYEQLFEMPP